MATKTHPTYKQMITTALLELKDRTGSSRQSIKKYVAANYPVGENCNMQCNLAMKRGVIDGTFISTKGPSSSIKLSAEAKAASVKASKAKATTAKKATTTKAKSTTKKPATKTKKATTTKAKTATKKPATKKSVTKAKKSPVKKAKAAAKAGKKAAPKKKKAAPKKAAKKAGKK